MKCNATELLNLINGINVTEINGISETSASTLLAEVGNDMAQWKSEEQFTSRLNGICYIREVGL